MSNRYEVKAGSDSGHCCFDATVIDTTIEYGNTAECFDKEDARRIAACLNICEGMTTEAMENWAKVYASDGLNGAGSDLYARWLETFKEAEALRSALSAQGDEQ